MRLSPISVYFFIFLYNAICLSTAPEVYSCSLGECTGYSYPVDWWSLGVTLYEVMSRCRPYDIHSNTTAREVRSMMSNSTSATPIPPKCSEQLSVLFQRVRNTI